MAVPHPLATVEYPSSDGLPMAESDFQRKPLMCPVEALDIYFQHHADVYVSGNMFMYYEEGNPEAAAEARIADLEARVRGMEHPQE